MDGHELVEVLSRVYVFRVELVKELAENVQVREHLRGFVEETCIRCMLSAWVVRYSGQQLIAVINLNRVAPHDVVWAFCELPFDKLG
jgi:hypothetical protein